MLLSRAQVREVDRRAIHDYGLPGVVLMENAGRGCAELLLRLGVHAPVCICCGKGNNGGDGFVIARHLDAVGVAVLVLLFADPAELTGDAAVNYHVIAKAGLPVVTLAGAEVTVERLNREWVDCEWVVDALFGTGLSGPVRPPFDAVIDAINAGGLRVLAVDIPSGLDCDTGEPLGPTVRAHHTATFVALKQGFVNPAAQPYLGQIHVLSIGAPHACVEGAEVFTGG